jgi:uncharacterized protein (DUF2249 family)
MKPTVLEITLNVCGLMPPEPMERVLKALGTLEKGQRLRMLIDRDPLPLYDLLVHKGFEYSKATTDDGLREIRIWQKP